MMNISLPYPCRFQPGRSKRSITDRARGERRFRSPGSAPKQRMVGRSCPCSASAPPTCKLRPCRSMKVSSSDSTERRSCGTCMRPSLPTSLAAPRAHDTSAQPDWTLTAALSSSSNPALRDRPWSPTWIIRRRRHRCRPRSRSPAHVTPCAQTWNRDLGQPLPPARVGRRRGRAIRGPWPASQFRAGRHPH
jgi:hypothetical protein